MWENSMINKEPPFWDGRISNPFLVILGIFGNGLWHWVYWFTE
jgi:hypothetical protein